MAQIKIFGLRSALQGRQQLISTAIHRATTAVLSLPEEKRFHRFCRSMQTRFSFRQIVANVIPSWKFQCLRGAKSPPRKR